ncbi:hypothetical protein P245_05010 [Comamonas thiooxydans]|uniref:Uncharacterized protein n=1 Tax=Comamonas thiooxydans TaxID=363952 RepID=A0A0E3BPV8_9BURK|nr:hypothetical protein [Comamonas thiooxydans]KGG97679.1 hypothetical protein P245_05010 [Comamonas thiooxydans]
MFEFKVGRAHEILIQAMLQPLSIEPPSKTLAEIAREMGLIIEPINLTKGTYFGDVLGIDENQCLVKYRAGGAILLDLDEIPEGDISPQGGDQVSIQARLGLLKVAVKMSSRRAREEQKRLAGESHNSSHMGGQ